MTGGEVFMLAVSENRAFLADGVRKWASPPGLGDDPVAVEKEEGHGASTLLALG